MKIDYVKINSLCKELKQRDNFVFYGTGMIAEVLFNKLVRKDCLPLYCVISNLKEGVNSFNGISVYGFEEKYEEIERENLCVVIAVSEVYENEIIEKLKEKKINNFILGSKYIWNPVNEKNFNKIYKEKEEKWFFSQIEEWYLDSREEKIEDIEFVQKDFKVNTGKIIFVVESFSARVIKIAIALKDKGKEVEVLLNEQMKNRIWNKYIAYLDRKNIKYSYYSIIEELMYLLLKKGKCVVHVFAHMWNPYVAYLLIKNKKMFGFVVFENYDIGNGFYLMIEQKLLALEQWCLENADGISYREYDIDFLKSDLNIQLCEKRISFFDYCLGSNVEIVLKDESDSLSLCYVGGLHTDVNNLLNPFSGLLELAEECEKAKCHLYVYCSSWDEEKYKEYIKKDKELLYFHFCKPLPHEKLLEEISKYDFGIASVRDGNWGDKNSSIHTKYKYIYGCANKYFDYLDAGLPIISSFPEKLCECLEEKNILLNWTNGQYDFEFLYKVKDEMKKRVLEVRKEWEINVHINRLIDFYDSL